MFQSYEDAPDALNGRNRVVLLRRDSESDFHPAGERKLLPGDAIAILGGPAQINQLVHNNQ